MHISNMIKKILLVFYCLVSSTIYSQNLTIKRNQLLDYLFYTTAELQDVNSNHEKSLYLAKLPEQDKSLQYDRQIFIKYKQHLYLLFEGTGRVYQASTISDSAIFFQRIDSTLYNGYNFLSINFCFSDTLYSLGGYGFWRFNGQLRYFSNHQWSIMPINKEIGLVNHLSYFSQKESKLFTITKDFQNEAEKPNIKTTLPTKVILTDLPNKRNEVLGEINPEISNILIESSLLWKSKTLNGIVITYNHWVYLINFQKNKIYRANSGKILDNLLSNVQDKTGYIFQSSDTVYYVKNTNKDKLFFFTISENDFEKEGIPLYTDGESSDNLELKLLSALLLSSILGVIFLKIYKKRKKVNAGNLMYEGEKNFPISLSQSDPTSFSNFEMQIIDTIIREKIVTVDTINRILGLSKKSLEIQKKSRNDVIHRINHKFKILCEVETDLIERIRSEEDKRYFKYHITKANEQIYLNHIKNPDSKRK